MAFITTTAASISSGGTINGDLTIEGDLTVNGDGAGNYDEIINGNLVLSSGSKLGIGIGDADPATELEVVSSDRTSVRIKGTLTSDGVVSDIQFFNASDSVGAINMNRVSNNDQADMTFHTQPNSGSVTERMRIDSNGSVGIGTSSPTNQGSALHIYQNHASNNTFLTVESDGANASAYIDIDTAADRDGFIRFKEAGTDKASIFNDASADSLVLTDGANSNTVFIKANKLGIGTASPSVKLQIEESTNGADIQFNMRALNDSGTGRTSAMKFDPDARKLHIGEDFTNLVLDTDNVRVGIGNDSPVDLLHVGAGADSPAVDSVAIFTHTGTTNVAIRDASSDVELLNYAYSGGGLIGTVTSHDLSIRTNNTNRLTITSGGNISINDSSSIKQLNVLDTDNAAGRFTRSTASATTGHLSDAFVVRGKTGGDMADGFGTMIAFEINDSANSDNSIGGCGMMRDGADNSGKFFIANNNAGTYATNFYVDKTGKVGIKNDSPATALDIKGTDNTSSKITITNTSGTDNIWSIHANYNTQALTFTGDSAEVMTLLDTGLVGINVSDPSEELEVKASGDSCILINTSTANNDAQLKFWTGDSEDWIVYADGGATNDPLMFYDAASSGIMMTLNNGNVGIGDTTPDDKLSIYGGDKQIRMGASDSNHVVIGRNSSSGNFEMARTCTDAAEEVFFRATENEAGALTFFVSEVSRLVIDANSRISLSNNDSGASNTVFGKLAGNALASGGNYNLLMGEDAGNDLTTSDHNVAIGFQALSKATANLDGNTAVGNYAMGSVVSNDVNNCTALGYASMSVGVLETTASGTVAVGFSALNNLTSGAGNTAIGYTALTSCTSGGSNIAIGDTALEDLVTGGANVAIGRNAGKEMGAAENGNILIGMAAGQSLDEGTNGTIDSNIAIGKDSFTGGNLNTSSTAITGNIAIGTDALNSTGTNAQTGTIAIGYQSLTALTSGVSNVAVGYQSLDACTTGSQNTAVGESALSATDDGASNVAIGNSAMGIGNAGHSNVAVGSQSMVDLTGNYNTALGMQSAFDLTSGVGNVALGALALKLASGGESYNVAVGVDAMTEVIENGNTADSNIAIGAIAMKGGTLGGDFIGNIAIGRYAMDDTDTNAQTGAIAIGHNSLTALTSGNKNVAIGYESGKAVTTGERNVIIGYQAGLTTTDVDSAIIIGNYAGTSNMTSDANGAVAIGRTALSSLVGGGNCTAVGYQSLQDNVSGYNNTAFGYQALTNATGGGNSSVGSQAGDLITSGTNNTLLGSASEVSANNAINQTVIGQGSTGNQNYGTVIGNKGMFQFASKEYTAHYADGEDLKSASAGAGLKLPAYSIIKSISVVVTQLSNLGTYKICLVLADESSGVADNSAFTNPVEVLGDGVDATLSGNSSSKVDIDLGSSAVVKQSYHMDEAINVGTSDKYLHLAQAGTGNGDTNPTTNGLLNIMVEYIGLD